MKSKPFFIPDENNLGGRTFINTLVYNHHKSLLLIKPIIKTRGRKEEHEGGRREEGEGRKKGWGEGSRREEEGGGRIEQVDKLKKVDGEIGRGGEEKRGGRGGGRGEGKGGGKGGGRGGGKGGGKREDDMTEVYHAFKKIHNIKKAYIDNIEPNTMPLIEKMNKNRKKNTFVQDEHKLNLLSQEQRKKRRILHIERYMLVFLFLNFS